MSDVKRCIKFFTLFDYDKEEKWLREMHKKAGSSEKAEFVLHLINVSLKM